jgi:putative peptidoglycan lipid II flippase
MPQPLKTGLRFIALEVRGMHEAAYILAAFSLASQLLALVRDRIFAATFGAGHTLDIYYAAFRTPDLLFNTVASLFSLYALLPILSRIEAQGQGRTVSFLRHTLLVFFAGMSAISLVAYIFTPALARFFAPGIAQDAGSYAQLVLLMRILLLQPILLGASNTVASLTQLRHRFVLYSVSPLLYNLGIIFGATVLYPHLGIAGLGWGVVLGAALHLSVQLPYFFAEKGDAVVPLYEGLRGVYEVLKLSVPRTLALASTQITLVVLTALASFLAAGSIAVFNFAFNLQAVPLTIIGVSYSVAAFPTLARLHASGARREFASYVETAVRHIIFWALPATVFIIVLRAQIVRLVLGAGHFDWSATRLTAAALALFILALLGQSVTLLISRAYYAAGNTKKPFYFGLADITLSVVSALGFSVLFTHSDLARNLIESLLRVDDVPGTSILMLALGYACGSIAEALVGYYFFARDFGVAQERVRRLVFQSFAASVLGGFLAYATLQYMTPVVQLHTLGIAAEGFAAGTFGITGVFCVLWLLGSEELKEIVAALVRRFRDVPQVALEPTDAAAQ